jgi:hypothetical protein
VLPQHKVEQKKNKKKETIMMIVRVKNAEEVCGRQVRTGKGRPAWLRAAADALISGRKSEKHYTNALIPSTQHWSMHARKGGKKRQTNKYLTESIHQQSSVRGWAKKKSPKKTPNRLHHQQRSMREEKQTQQTDRLRQLWSNRETGKQQKPIAPRAPTKHHKGRNYRRGRKSEIPFGKTGKKTKQNKTEGKYLIRPNG